MTASVVEQPLPEFLTRPKGFVELAPTHAIRTSEQGVKFIQGYEKFSEISYLDQGGLPTIGWGHLIELGVTYSEPMTRAFGDELFRKDLLSTERSVLRLTQKPLSQHQFDALVSFVFNVGAGAYQRSTLRQMILNNMDSEIPTQFLRWNKVGGRVSRGLTRRRIAEALMYTQGCYEQG